MLDFAPSKGTYMDKRDLEQLLSDVAGGAVAPADALTRIQTAPTADLGFAQLDLSRGVRQGAGEVVYGAGKPPSRLPPLSKRCTMPARSASWSRAWTPKTANRTSELLDNGIDLDMSRTHSSPSWEASPPLPATDASSSPAPARATYPSPKKPR